jgi:glycosyltransferase involved in cell wall biosynthesis
MNKLQEQFINVNACVLVPTYNNEDTLKEVIDSILKYTDRLIIVNDGSTDHTSEILLTYPDIDILSFEENRGKGMALRAGMERGLEKGYEHVIALDSDGQHKASDLGIFLKALAEYPECLYVGARNMSSENVPGKSSFGNNFSNFWFRVNTGIDLPDTQSGYRSYPVRLVKDIQWKTERFEFEIEVLVRSAWKEIDVKAVPINVYYPPAEERVSHFRTVRDFARISVLNTIFVTLAIFTFWPKKLIGSLKKKGPKEVFRQYFYDPAETNKSITLSVMLGVFISITPFWGFQIILIIFFAHLLKLNKAIALIAGHISIPPTIPFILYGSYMLGAKVLGSSATIDFSKSLTLEVVKENFLQYVVGAFFLAAITSIIISVITYILLLIFRPKNPQKLEL